MGIHAGEKLREGDFKNASDGSADKIVVTKTGGKIDETFIPRTTPTKQKFTDTESNRGSSTTRFDITKAGNTVRYTYDGTGTDPNFSAANFPVGSAIYFNCQNFNSANNGKFFVTGSGSNYVEVTNSGGVAENDKTIGTGFVRKLQVWTKPTGVKYIKVRAVGGGKSGTNALEYNGSVSPRNGEDSLVGNQSTIYLLAAGGVTGTTMIGDLTSLGGPGGNIGYSGNNATMAGKRGVSFFAGGYGCGGDGATYVGGSYYAGVGGDGAGYADVLIDVTSITSLFVLVGKGGVPDGTPYGQAGSGVSGVVEFEEHYL